MYDNIPAQVLSLFLPMTNCARTERLKHSKHTDYWSQSFPQNIFSEHGMLVQEIKDMDAHHSSKTQVFVPNHLD